METAESASEPIRAIVLGLWLQAIKDGERTLLTALHEIKEPLTQLNRVERDAVLGQFVWHAMQVAPQRRKILRGLPSAWKLENKKLVDQIYAEDGLKKNNPENYENTAFHRAALIWQGWGIPATVSDVRKWYKP